MFGLLIAITKPKIIHCFNNERASPWEDVCGALSYYLIWLLTMLLKYQTNDYWTIIR